MRNFRFPIFLTAFFFFCQSASATVTVSIDSREIPQTKIVFLGFGNQTDEETKFDSAGIFRRIESSLNTTNLFNVIEDKTILVGKDSLNIFTRDEKYRIVNDERGVTVYEGEDEDLKEVVSFREIIEIDDVPNFDKYSATDVSVIVISKFSYDNLGNLRVKVRAWDILDRRQMFGKVYTVSPDNYRKASNVISDEIFKAVTGEAVGHFNSEIVYAAESGGPFRRTKKIRIVGFDGEDNRFLTDGSDLVLTPVFIGNKNEIYYLRYYQGKPQIFKMDTNTLLTKRVGGFRGTTFAASPHPKDNNLLLLSASFNGNSDIYEMNIADNTARRLTSHPGIDTTASYSPDAQKIVFSSDRSGSQKIYEMDLDGGSLKKISSGEGAYSKPIYSPDGRMIAFTKIRRDVFYIGVMNADGSNERLLVSAYLVEGAKWSPNGRYLIYSKKRGSWGEDSVPRLFTVDIVTGYEYEIPTPKGEGATDPDWR